VQRCHGHASTGDRGLEPFVLIRDRQAHAVQPAFLERAQEPCTERAAMIACSDRRRGSRKFGKYADPSRVLEINSSIPIRVSDIRGRYPLR